MSSFPLKVFGYLCVRVFRRCANFPIQLAGPISYLRHGYVNMLCELTRQSARLPFGVDMLAKEALTEDWGADFWQS